MQKNRNNERRILNLNSIIIAYHSLLYCLIVMKLYHRQYNIVDGHVDGIYVYFTQLHNRN